MDRNDCTTSAPNEGDELSSFFSTSYPTEPIDSDFQRKYPPDTFGEEFGPSARVWNVYKDEAISHDQPMLDGWNKSLDILLIFAGLFSAVVTAFVVESYKLLQPDYEEYIAGALFKVLSNSSSISQDRSAGLNAPSDFTPSTLSRWLNALWFTSLVLSLVVAFLCILLKQWIEEYHRRITAPYISAQQWARRRALYFNGLATWAFPVLIAVLPLILHAALFLFLAGLATLLWDLDNANAAWISVIAASLLAFYAASTILPFIRADCPSSTPLASLLREPLLFTVLRAKVYLSSLAVDRDRTDGDSGSEQHSTLSRSSFFHRAVELACKILTSVCTVCKRGLRRFIPARLRTVMWGTYWSTAGRIALRWHVTARSFIRELPHHQISVVDAHVLRWLMTSDRTADVASVGFHAAGALAPWSSTIDLLRGIPSIHALVSQILDNKYRQERIAGRSSTAAAIARDLRSATGLFGLSDGYSQVHRVAPEMYTIQGARIDYDLPVLLEVISVMHGSSNLSSVLLNRFRRSHSNLGPEPPAQFLLSTAYRLLHASKLPLQLWLSICRSLPFHDIPLADFVQIAKGLLRYTGSDRCPQESLHRGEDCGIQCSFELLSEVILSRESLGLTDADARTALEILLLYAPVVYRGEPWGFVEDSHLLRLLGSDIFTSHSMLHSGSSIFALVLRLTEIAHCWRNEHGLPPWTEVWDQAIRGILVAARRARERDVPLGRQGRDTLASRIADVIMIMFNIDEGVPHVRILSTDGVSQLPIRLLTGGEASAWNMLLRFPHDRNVDSVANLLAAALCTALRRGVDIHAEFHELVSGDYMVDRLLRECRYDLEADHSLGLECSFVTLVRHCNEVEPDWFPALFGRALDRQDDDRKQLLITFGSYVTNEVTRLGPCAECPDGPRSRSLISRLYRQTFGPQPAPAFPYNRTYEEAVAFWRAPWVGV